MIKRILFLALLLFTTRICNAQYLAFQGEEMAIPGLIVYKDSVNYVRFLLVSVRGGISFEGLQNKVRYLDKDGNRKKLRPNDAEEIRFQWEQQDIQLVSRRPILHSRRKKFMHVYIDGPVRVYEYIKTYRYTGRQGMTYARINTAIYGYFERPGEQLISPKAIGFRKQMKNYFKDCQELVDRIQAKIYTRRDMESIARFYNTRCPHGN